MTRALFSLVDALVIASACGCIKQQTAPELPYSQNEVEQINEKVDNFEW